MTKFNDVVWLETSRSRTFAPVQLTPKSGNLSCLISNQRASVNDMVQLARRRWCLVRLVERRRRFLVKKRESHLIDFWQVLSKAYDSLFLLLSIKVGQVLIRYLLYSLPIKRPHDHSEQASNSRRESDDAE
jgi:hypothetical protein